MGGIKILSVLDGRYGNITEKLCDIFSEYGLIKYRVQVEIEWLKFILADLKLVEFDMSIIEQLDRIKDEFLESDAQRVKTIEKTTNHDVKAVEYFIKEKLKEAGLAEIQEWVHFACTSDDINNTSYALMLKKGKEVVTDALEEFVEAIETKAFEFKAVPMMSRTHGQPASPTTVGKEFVNFAWRLRNEIDIVRNASVQAKINGATGNYNAHYFVFPDVDWIDGSQRFLTRNLGLDPLLLQPR